MHKRILTVQDISCVGQCSITVALPVLSVLGLETAILPTAILSTHTAAGFNDFYFRDMGDDIPEIMAHWKREDIKFDAIYTGYLGRKEHVAHVKELCASFLHEGAKIIIDPAMADFGKLYSGFDEDYVGAMKELSKMADIIMPNVTEACLLTDSEYVEKPTKEEVSDLLDELKARYDCEAVITGVGFVEGETGAAIITKDGEKLYYHHRLIDRVCHGTGDIFSSVFTGMYLRGADIIDAVKTAADFTLECIENTTDDREHWYGVDFEGVLWRLAKDISTVYT